MTRLPDEGPVVVITDSPLEWGSVVADRNASGQRTALYVATPMDLAAAEVAAEMGREMFREPAGVLDARGRA